LYESYFCDTKRLGVIIRQTTKQDVNGNAIWKDITTDIVVNQKRTGEQEKPPGNKRRKTSRGY